MKFMKNARLLDYESWIMLKKLMQMFTNKDVYIIMNLLSKWVTI